MKELKRVTNNGFNTAWFSPTRGSTQGCCLSPFIFVIVVEILAKLSRENGTIEGSRVKRREVRVSLLLLQK